MSQAGDILGMLAHGPMTFKEIWVMTGWTRSTTFYTLNKLIDSKDIERERHGAYCIKKH